MPFRIIADIDRSHCPEKVSTLDFKNIAAPRFRHLLVPWKLLQRLKLNHFKSRMECGFSDIFSHHICSTIAETIGVSNYSASFGAKNIQKITFEAAEMMRIRGTSK